MCFLRDLGVFSMRLYSERILMYSDVFRVYFEYSDHILRGIAWLPRSESLLACSLGLSDAEGTRHLWDAVDGLPRRSRYRTAELGRIDAFPQFTAT